MGNLNCIPRDMRNTWLSENTNPHIPQLECIKIKQLNKEAYKKIKEYELTLTKGDIINDIRSSNFISLQKYHIKTLKVDHWNYGLYRACHGNNIELVNEMIKKGANNWNSGLYAACQGNSIKLANLMIEKGANDFNDGLRGSCTTNSIESANLMIEKGANDWNQGLYYACLGSSTKSATLMIEKGATKCEWCSKSINDHKN